ncbi:Teratocarcinoma-derived growth factor 1 [Saguinus oedipus]|uniref:Teratocarcinoma-derived growth factor 1 n=1 Tax=Saguinus oedipus TaxID=9490 RepID=A0ABQ9U1U0_SAGOE|nr:Teratocarcinoma-derived growth factor 1 [Saguinus oedipus]
MARFSSSVIWIMAISKAFELGLVAGLGHQELARPSQGDLAFRDDSVRPQEEPAIRSRSSKLVPPVGIQHKGHLVLELLELGRCWTAFGFGSETGIVYLTSL